MYMWPGAHPGCICAYGRGRTPACMHIRGRGPTPVYMYVHVYVCRPGAPPGCVYIYIYICTIPRGNICFVAGEPGSPSEYIRSVMEQASRLHGSGCTSTPWREVTLMKIPRFFWFALHFVEESHVVGTAVGSGKSFQFPGLHSVSSRKAMSSGRRVVQEIQ